MFVRFRKLMKLTNPSSQDPEITNDIYIYFIFFFAGAKRLFGVCMLDMELSANFHDCCPH